jgi:hypothetical protein
VQSLYLAALALTGIAALFLSMPPQYQPPSTDLLINASTAFLRYGPYPKPASELIVTAFSSTAILLACVPLFDALRSSGRRNMAAVVLSPLAVFASMHIARTAQYFLGASGVTVMDVYSHQLFFCPLLLIQSSPFLPTAMSLSGSQQTRIVMEVIKWFDVLLIAIWLSAAQFAAWRKPKLRAAP